MRIDLLTLCDAAVEVNGRLHVLASVDYFWAATLPYIHPKCTLAARLRWEGHERVRKHKLSVHIVDADGASIATEFCRKITPPVPSHDDIPAVRHVILELEKLRFESYGPYAVRIEADGEEVGYLPFGIVPATSAHQPHTI